MFHDQASGLRQWSQARTLADERAAPATLVVMVWAREGAAVEALVSSLRLPAGASCWQPRVLALSEPMPEPLPEALPVSCWWVLHPVSLPPHRASELADALRRLQGAGMPRTVLLTASDAELVRAARTHLGVRLVQDQKIWTEAVMTPSQAG